MTGDKFHHVYRIHNPVANRSYIGLTKDFKLRMQEHWFNLRHGHHCCKDMQRDYSKDGDKFIKEILFSSPDRSVSAAIEREIYLRCDKPYNIKTPYGLLDDRYNERAIAAIKKMNGKQNIEEAISILESMLALY